TPCTNPLLNCNCPSRYLRDAETHSWYYPLSQISEGRGLWISVYFYIHELTLFGFASFSRRKRRKKRFHANQILIIIVFKKNLYDPTFLSGDFNEFLLIDIQPMKRFSFMPFIFILEMDLAEIMVRFRDAVFLV